MIMQCKELCRKCLYENVNDNSCSIEKEEKEEKVILGGENCPKYIEATEGIYGRLHFEFLRDYHPYEMEELYLQDKLKDYLALLNKVAMQRIDDYVDEALKKKPAPEEFFAKVRYTESLREQAREIVLNDLVYVVPDLDLL